MKNSQKFGPTLRELRQKAGLTLRELAEKVDVNFTYLSKIENGALPPPSAKVIGKLAEVLNYDKDELLALGGVIPSDIAEILKDRHVQEKVRAEMTRRSRVSDKKAFSLPRVSLPLKGLYRLALPVFLVIAVALSLWFASPTQALEVTYSALGAGTLGSTYTFTVTVSIEDTEHVPLSRIDVAIYNVAAPGTHTATLASMPLGDSAAAAHNPTEVGSGTATVAANADGHWGYTPSDTGYADWDGTAYSFLPDPVGGYAYQGGVGTTSIVYTIVWTPPANWPEGSYKIKTTLTTATQAPGGGTTFIKTSDAFTLTTTGGGGGAPPATTTTPPGTTSVSGKVDSTGKFTQTVTANSGDNKVKLTINQGVTGLTSTGEPLTELTITPMTTAPDPPTGSNVIGLTYEFGPPGATFVPDVTVTFTLPAGVDPEGLVVAFYNSTTGQWIELTNLVFDPLTNTYSGDTSHFTAFAVFTNNAPASFSNLVITPAEVVSGETSTIKVTATNTGDFSRTYDVVFKVNSITIETRSVTLAGRASTDVTFSLTRTTVGTCTIGVDGLSGTLTVKAAPTTPAPTTPAPTTPAPTTPAPTTPAPTTPTPTQTITPTPTTTPTPVGINMWVIGGIIIAVIIVAVIIWLVIARRRD